MVYFSATLSLSNVARVVDKFHVEAPCSNRSHPKAYEQRANSVDSGLIWFPSRIILHFLLNEIVPHINEINCCNSCATVMIMTSE